MGRIDGIYTARRNEQLNYILEVENDAYIEFETFCEWLKTEFGYRLHKFIKEYGKPIGKENLEKRPATYLIRAMREEGLLTDFSPDIGLLSKGTVNRWMRLSGEYGRIARNIESRKHIYAIAFAMQLNVEQLIELFHEVYIDRVVYPWEAEELIYYYCIRNRRSYRDARAILSRYRTEEAHPAPATAFATAKVVADVDKCKDDEAFMDLLRTYTTAYRMGMSRAIDLLVEAKKQAVAALKEDYTKAQQAKQQDKFFSGKHAASQPLALKMNIDFDNFKHYPLLYRHIIGTQLTTHEPVLSQEEKDNYKERQKQRKSKEQESEAKYKELDDDPAVQGIMKLIFGGSELQTQEVQQEDEAEIYDEEKETEDIALSENDKNEWNKDLNESKLPIELTSEFPKPWILRRAEEELSKDQTRKLLIFLNSWLYWRALGRKPYGADTSIDESREAFMDYKQTMNDMLQDADFPPLYAGNPHDWLYLYCAGKSNPLEEMQLFWENSWDLEKMLPEYRNELEETVKSAYE